VFEHGGDKVVGDKFSLVHTGFHFAGARMIEFREIPELLPHLEEMVTVIGSDFACLSPFPGTLDSDKEDIHNKNF
jgi:hypothetical protein